jgi:hypothetical protein
MIVAERETEKRLKLSIPSTYTCTTRTKKVPKERLPPGIDAAEREGKRKPRTEGIA